MLSACIVTSLTICGLLLAPCLRSEGLSVYERAANELQRGDSAAAIRTIEPVVQQSPSDLKALTLLGMALTAAGKTQDADARYQSALRTNPQYAPALRGLAMNEMAAGNVASAQGHFESLLKLTPNDSIAHLALAEISFNKRRYAEAVRHFELSAGTYTIDPRNILKFADAAIQIREHAKAESVLTSLPPSVEAEHHLQAGLMLARMGRYEAAAGEFERGLLGRDKYLAGYNLALARLKANHSDAAITQVEKLIQEGYRTAELYNVQAQAYEKSGRTREAYEALRTATQIDPGDETNYLDLIAICVEHKNLDMALQIADIGVRVLPKSDRLQLQRGVVLAVRGDYDEARKSFSDATSLAPGKGLPQIALGLMLLQADQAGEAAKVLRTGTRGGNDQYLYQWFLAEALSRSGVEPGSADEQEAVKGLYQCVQKRPDLAPPRVLLGKFLARRGELDGAVAEFERALKLEPDNAAALYQLAQAYRKQGDKRAAELFARISKTKADERDELTRKGLQLISEGAK